MPLRVYRLRHSLEMPEGKGQTSNSFIVR